MNKKDTIRILFNRLLDNSISEIELDELLLYIRDAESERVVKALMEENWERLKDRSLGSEMEPRSLERFSAIAAKAGLKKEIVPESSFPMRRTGWWIGVAASLMLLISAGIYWVFQSSVPTISEITESKIARAFQGKQVVHLPDGSTVILNEESRISYQEDFGDEVREVVFAGEGYFDIAPDPDRPFIVRTGEIRTTVLGTAFNLVAREDQSEVKVAVERGEVVVGDQQHVYDHILPEEELVVDVQTQKYEKDKADLARILAWKQEFLILDDVTIEEAATLIGHRYQIAMNIENKEVERCRINASFLHGETLEQVLRVICGVLQAEYVIDNGTVYIKGGRICK